MTISNNPPRSEHKYQVTPLELFFDVVFVFAVSQLSQNLSSNLTWRGTAEQLRIAPRRRDGTLRNLVTIWVVRVGDDLYVRSYRGRDGAWFRAAQRSHEGWIRAGGVEKDVAFVAESDPALNDQIDAAYRSKYSRYPQYVAPLVTAEGRATTIKLLAQ